MRQLLFGLAVLPFLASIASAGQVLSDRQMDVIVAGFVASVPGPVFTTDQPFAMALTFGTVSTEIEEALPKNILGVGSPF